MAGEGYSTIQMSRQAILEEKVQPGEATGDSGVGGVTSGQAGKSGLEQVLWKPSSSEEEASIGLAGHLGFGWAGKRRTAPWEDEPEELRRPAAGAERRRGIITVIHQHIY